MIISEDGSITGSIDNSRLDEVKPKSDEAKAQLEQLKRERDEANAGATTDAERLAELHKAQSIEGQSRDEVSTPADASGDPNKAAEKDAAAKAEADKAQARRSASSSGKE